MRRLMMSLAAVLFGVLLAGLTSVPQAVLPAASAAPTCSSTWTIHRADYIHKLGDEGNHQGAVQLLRRKCYELGDEWYQYVARGFAYYEPMPGNLRLVVGIRNRNAANDDYLTCRANICTTPPQSTSCKWASAGIQKYNPTTGKWDLYAWGGTLWSDDC